MLKKEWKKHIPAEVEYWDTWLAPFKGQDIGNNPQITTPINEADIKNCIRNCGEPVKILDVGAGATSFLSGIKFDKKVEITATDFLAKEYVKLLRKYEIKYAVEPVFADFEKLVKQFGKESFDFVHCSNALDHSRDPEKGLREIMGVLKSGCYAYLKHYVNVGEREHYEKMHQWNFDSDGKDFFISGKKIDLSMYSDYSVRKEGLFIILNIKK